MSGVLVLERDASVRVLAERVARLEVRCARAEARVADLEVHIEREAALAGLVAITGAGLAVQRDEVTLGRIVAAVARARGLTRAALTGSGRGHQALAARDEVLRLALAQGVRVTAIGPALGRSRNWGTDVQRRCRA